MVMPRTILLVEDEHQLVSALLKKLQKVGYRVIAASNGEEALVQLKENVVDVVLLDLVMPGSDGVWFLEQIRSDAGYEDLPVIALTNLEQGEKVAKAISSGVYRLLIKSSTTLDQLLHCIEEVCRSLPQ
jgi:CheY-like chemotaxis protein